MNEFKNLAVYERIKGVFLSELNKSDIDLTGSTEQADVQEWDSLTNLALIAGLEKEFSIVFSIEELIAFKNVLDLYNIISNKINK
mgnify:FL=1|jgi:acyl carrier protein